MDNEMSPTEESHRAEEETRRELELALWQEQVFWLQKSRATWIVEEDRNTRFFHLSTLKRQRFNCILGLKNSEGHWIFDETKLRGMVVSFFKTLYHAELGVSPWLPKGFTALSASTYTGLERPIARDEIIQAIKSMGNLKAPGKDSYHPVDQTLRQSFVSHIT
ncbi:unnamed protein product [Linum trigynum]|uniref:Uncharacterized protein n=1 Tax=Linum trigynum TaxID=586398 RepID=A0AAV2D550_9ROSI